LLLLASQLLLLVLLEHSLALERRIDASKLRLLTLLRQIAQ